MKQEYKDFVEKQLKPFLENNIQEGDILSEDQTRIHYYAALRNDAYRFFQAGFNVFYIDLRGHGKSQHTDIYNDSRVHVNDFEEYVMDVHALVEQVVKKKSQGKKLFLFAHSMGGAVSTLYLEEYPDDFTCAVLSSPMLMMNYGKVPDLAVDVLSAYSKVVDVSQEFGPSQKPFNAIPDFEHSSMNINSI